MLEGLLIGGVALIIIDLVVRDQTQYRLSRLRSELMGLRSEEKRVSERRDEAELMVAQIGEALMRADRRRQSLERGCGSLQSMLALARRLEEAQHGARVGRRGAHDQVRALVEGAGTQDEG